MEITYFLLFFLFVALCWQPSTTADVKTYYIDAECDKTIYMDKKVSAAYFVMKRQYNYDECLTTVRAPAGKKLMVKIEYLEIGELVGLTCSDAYLSLLDGGSSFMSPLKGLRNTICSYSEEEAQKTFETTDVFLTFKYKSEVFAADKKGFKILVTAFNRGDCGTDDMSCSSGMCISSSLKCRGYNFCQDDTNMCPITIEQILAIVAGAVALLIIIIIIIVILCLVHRKKVHRKEVLRRAMDRTSTTPYMIDQKVHYESSPKVDDRKPDLKDDYYNDATSETQSEADNQ